MRRSAVLVLCMVVFLQGCMAYAASAAGYMDAKIRYDKPYNEYRMQAEEINKTRQTQGLPPEPIKDFNGWFKEQPLTNNQIKVLKNFGIIKPEEVKAIKEREALRRAELKAKGGSAASVK
ncbi:MAG: hypothetical protein Q8O22_02945 [Candidatus Omnitrophota bacterium]|nr:hypothetical protein [Candidatus Omnitrophota bacterium]